MAFTSTQGIKGTGEYGLSGAEGCTIACWLNLTDVGGKYIWSLERDTYWQLTWSGTSLAVRDNKVNWNGTRKDFSVTAPPLSTWTHVVMTYEKGIIKFYYNGNLSQTLEATGGTALNTGINQCVIGTTVQSHTGMNGSICDFRIYNKALTEDEIHELALGKIAHYLLHCGPNRYKVLPDGYKSIDGVNGNSTEQILTGVIATEKTTAYLDYYPTNANSPFGRGDGAFNVTGNSGKVSWRWGSPQQTKNAYGPNVNQRIRLWFGQHCAAKYGAAGSLSFDFTDSNAFTTSDLYIFGRGGDVLSGIIYKFTLWEDGILSHDLYPAIRASDSKVGFLDLITNTFYTNNSWTAVEVTDNIENDCSGFNHSLDAIGFTFNNVCSNDTMRYDRVINFTTASQYLKGSNITMPIKTICFWAKLPASLGTAYQCFVGNRTGNIAFGLGSGLFVTTGWDGSKALYTPTGHNLNNWNWFCIYYNPSNNNSIKMYVNNVECPRSTTNNNFTYQTSDFLINARNNGSYTSGMNQPMSDLRIYITELSEADRNKLYNMGRLS